MALLHFLRCRTCIMRDVGRGTVSAMEYSRWFPGGNIQSPTLSIFNRSIHREERESLVGIYLGFPPALWQSMKISAAWLAARLTLHILFFPHCSTPICQNPHGGLWQKLLFLEGENSWVWDSSSCLPTPFSTLSASFWCEEIPAPLIAHGKSYLGNAQGFVGAPFETLLSKCIAGSQQWQKG